MSNPEVKHALVTFIFVIAYMAAPVCFVFGVFSGDLLGFALCLASAVVLAVSYVLASQPRSGASRQEALLEITFWSLLGMVLASAAIFVLHRPWPALLGLVVAAVLLVLVWQRASPRIRSRIRQVSPL